MKRWKALTAVALTLLLAWIQPALAEDEPPNYIEDQNGCKVVNPHPRAEESITWTGGCKDGWTDGTGVLQWFQSGIADEKYEGEMKRGYAEGKGVQTMVDGGRYEGEFKQSRQHGEGSYYAPDGSIYSGGWKDGKPHGAGRYRTPEGRDIRGQWVDGEFRGEAEDDPNRT
jgi:hypothetical protein